MLKRQNLSFPFYSWQKNAQLLPSLHYWQSNDNTNSACSNNDPWKLRIPIPSHCGTLVSKQDYIFLRVFLMLEIQLPSSKIRSKQPPPQPHEDQSCWHQQAREDEPKRFPSNWTLSILDPRHHRKAFLINVSYVRAHLHRNHRKATCLTHFQVILI